MENIMNNAIQQWGPLTGRILISLIFLMSGFGKVFQFDGQVAYAASQGVPLASLAIIISIIAELDDPGKHYAACLLEHRRPYGPADAHDHVHEKPGNDGCHAANHVFWAWTKEHQ